MHIEDEDRACTWIACDCCGAIGEFGERDLPPYFCGQCGALLFPKVVTYCDPKPIPDRRFDWSAVTDNYEGGCPIGYGLTEQEAVNDLLEQLS